jgi:glycerophosphoryl diester phosphodiesterase
MRIFAVLAAAVLVSSCSITPSNEPPRTEKVLVAHRGASAYAPEHTRAAYELALAQGADYVEQDLGVTKDGVLVCLHDDSLERTTNVRDVFPGRSTIVGGTERWMLADFTLAEVKQLDAGSWFDERFAGERVLTWDEAVEIVRGRAGLYPELKSPALYHERGIDQVALLAAALRRHGFDRPANGRPPVIVQSFDPDALRQLAAELPDVPRVFLVDVRMSRTWLTIDGITRIREFASGIGPNKSILLADPPVVARAHAAGLTVTPYTFRSSDTAPFEDVAEEMRHFLYELNVDGVFTDNPDRFPRP